MKRASLPNGKIAVSGADYPVIRPHARAHSTRHSMHLTKAEFAQIRHLQWRLTTVGSVPYQTTASELDTRLFWLDFLRLVFAPLYASQSGVSQIGSFDITQPVLLGPGRNLLLPTTLESAMYYARNKRAPPVRFEGPYGQMPVLVAALIVLAVVALASLLFTSTQRPSALDRLL